MPLERPSKDRDEPGESRNSLRLSPRDLAALLDELDAASSAAAPANREFIRWPFRHDVVQVLVPVAGGGASRITMACRNLSRTGLALLHSCYMHPGTACTVVIPHPVRGRVPIPGRVARCTHRAGVVHEIGISFNEPIDVREFIRLDPFADRYSLERVKPEELAGTVVYTDESEMDVRIVKHFLRGTSLGVRTAATISDALYLAEARPDLVITELNLPDGSGLELATSLRRHGFRMPVILVSSDTGDAARRAIAAAAPDACLAKPFTQSLLQRAIAEFLIVRRRGAAGGSPSGPDPETAALVHAFAGSIRQTVAQLEAAIRSGDAAGTRLLCLRLAGSAPTLGFAELGEMAQDAARTLERTRSLPDSLTHLRILIAACERTRRRAAA